MSNQKMRLAAYVLLLQNDHILLCRLGGTARSHRGYWTLPGGGIDFGEHPEDAARREVREETGLEVRLEGLAGIDSLVDVFRGRPMHSVRILYRGAVIGGTLQPEEDGSTDAAQWFTRAQAEALLLVDLARTGIRYAFQASS